MPSNRNRHGVRIAVPRHSARLAAFGSWNWRKERPTFEPMAKTETWNLARAAEVARAKRLIHNENYPTEAITWSVAQLLSQYLDF